MAGVVGYPKPPPPAPPPPPLIKNIYIRLLSPKTPYMDHITDPKDYFVKVLTSYN